MPPAPPPHRRRSVSPMDGPTDSHLTTVPTTKTNEEDDNSEIHVPEKRVEVKNGRSHLRSCKTLESNINSLPDDIVFDILVQIPAQDIYSAIRPVCRKWYQMIHTHKFRNTHLHHSTYGLLLQKRVSQSTELTFMTLSRQGQIELTRLNYEPEYRIWCSSCNGLMLGSKPSNHPLPYISNPLTMQSFYLPRPVYPLFGLGFAIAYASLSMQYKVVQVYIQERQWGCIILTVGVDETWRRVCTQHLSLEAKKNLLYAPLTTEGFVHWVEKRNCVLTLNVETEIITEYLAPSSGDKHYYFSTAKYLSLLISDACREWSWEIWEMKPETGEWTQLPGIDLRDRFGLLTERDTIYKLSAAYISSSLVPVGWLEYKEVLLYRVPLGICIAWNVRLKEYEFIELDSNLFGFFPHRISLLWLDGC